VASQPGNPHLAQVQNGVVYLSYMNRDGYIHQAGIGITSNFYSGLHPSVILYPFRDATL
jgi:hypothetical protein